MQTLEEVPNHPNAVPVPKTKTWAQIIEIEKQNRAKCSDVCEAHFSVNGVRMIRMIYTPLPGQPPIASTVRPVSNPGPDVVVEELCNPIGFSNRVTPPIVQQPQVTVVQLEERRNESEEEKSWCQRLWQWMCVSLRNLRNH